MALVSFKKERIPQYDLMRAVAMFLVVYVHSSFMFTFTPEADSKQAGLFWFTSILALVCNGLFFMVSGKFNLEPATKLKLSGYKAFYIKKVIDLLFPIVVYAVAFWLLTIAGVELFGAWDDGRSIWDIEAFLGMVHQLLISSWWFVPMIFSLMIFTPFLGRMLGALKKREVYVLLGLLFGCAAIVAIEKLIGYTSVFTKFLAPVFGIWVGFYILGYVVDKVKLTRKVLSGWYVAAAVLIIIFGSIFIFAPRLVLSADGPLSTWNAIFSAIFYPIIASALFLFFKNIKITGKKTKSVIEFMGNRAFGIYLIHFCFFFSYLHLLPEWLRSSDSAIFGIADRTIITTIVFALSLAVATVIDLFVLNPLQRRLKMRFLGQSQSKAKLDNPRNLV